jgi:hypothetical protein
MVGPLLLPTRSLSALRNAACAKALPRGDCDVALVGVELQLCMMLSHEQPDAILLHSDLHLSTCASAAACAPWGSLASQDDGCRAIPNWNNDCTSGK